MKTCDICGCADGAVLERYVDGVSGYEHPCDSQCVAALKAELKLARGQALLSQSSLAIFETLYVAAQFESDRRGHTIHRLERKLRRKNRKAARQHRVLGILNCGVTAAASVKLEDGVWVYKLKGGK